MDSTHAPQVSATAILIALVDRLRPPLATDADAAQARVAAELARLEKNAPAAREIGVALTTLLSQPHQSAFYAETGVRSALGFWLESRQWLTQRLLPDAPDDTRLRNVLRRVFSQADDHIWVAGLGDAAWVALGKALGLADAQTEGPQPIHRDVLEATRALSYRLAGTALDRELLRAESALEQYESPFLAQNVQVVAALTKADAVQSVLAAEEVREIDVLLDQCDAAVERVRRKAANNGISIRLTYLLARLVQLSARLRDLLALASTENALLNGVQFLQKVVHDEQHYRRLLPLLADNVSLVTRNIIGHASTHGEHYIADDRAAWWGMARSAFGGGIVIALMAALKAQLALLYLPPLTGGIVTGLNYGLGFALIHLLGFSVATKQPAMTAAVIASTIEETRPRELGRLVDLAQNVVRSQFIAVVGNVAAALPVACLIVIAWPHLFATDLPVPAPKLEHMLQEVHPFESGSLLFAAIAGFGLFLSGLASGYFDNQARYHALCSRLSHAPWLAWLGATRAAAVGRYVDAHYGAVLGNLLFGMYLGLFSAVADLTGLPADIRHVAFSSANLGSAIAGLGWTAAAPWLVWSVVGVALIAMVNLAVSFTLALWVAMRARQQDGRQIRLLGKLLLARFLQRPMAFFSPPPRV